MRKFLDEARTIDIRGLIEFDRNGHAPGEEDQGPEGQPFPDMAINDRSQREARTVEPGRPIHLRHLPDDIVDQPPRSEEHTSELQSRFDLVCRLLLEKKNN